MKQETMILTPSNDPYFYQTLATPIPSPSLPNSMVTPNAMVFKLGESVAVPMGLNETIEYMYGGEWDEREEEIDNAEQE